MINGNHNYNINQFLFKILLYVKKIDLFILFKL
jgi:hypothetical protein